MANESENLRDLIDSCRRQSNDLQSPEMQALAAALQSDPEVDKRMKKSHRIDELIGRSLRDVPVPDGLETRLLAALAEGKPRPEMMDSEWTAEEVAVIAPEPVNAPNITSQRLPVNPKSWRRWSAVIVAAAAVLLLVIWGVRVANEPTLASQEDVARHTGQWLASLSESHWETTKFPDQTHPMPRSPSISRYRWQLISNSPFNVVCYETQGSTRLFVCSTSIPVKLQTAPPATPIAATGAPAWLVGGWQSPKGLVYVLAVKGSAQQYRRVINRNTNLALVRRKQFKA